MAVAVVELAPGALDQADLAAERAAGGPGEWPADWPAPGPIDLEVHDRPHDSSSLEWWYVNCHLRTGTGREYSLFASFFRTAMSRDERTGANVYAHALTWALVDPAGERYAGEALVDREAPALVRPGLEQGDGVADPQLRRALLEVIEKGRVPLPDVLLTAPCAVAGDRLSLDYDGRRLERVGTDTYRLVLRHGTAPVGCDLTLRLTGPAIRHGADGVVHGTSGEAMFYYFLPRGVAEGVLLLDGESHLIEQATAWYDHEFGQAGAPGPALAGEPGEHIVSWDWLAAQLDDGTALSVYCMVDDRSGEPCGRYAVLVDPAGGVRRFQDDAFVLEGDELWTSSKTFARYPTAWRVEIPAARLQLEVQAAFPAQELVTSIARPAFWEGRVGLAGTVGGRAVRGLGFVERVGFEHLDTLPAFLGAVSRATRRSVEAVLPLELDARTAAPLVAAARRPDYLDGVDLGQLSRALIRPVRSVADRGGKAWRSYVALACCDAVGGDSQAYLPWLALPELMHVGSLMVDDVQDGSAMRRGGPAAHLLFGEGPSINAGSACYFLPQLFLGQAPVTAEVKARIYELYLEACRAAHAGQALDLDGLVECLRPAAEAGDGALAERRVRAVHRLKSAAPAGALARAGAVLGGGSEAQIEALGAFVEQVGLAFQIVDDVLNLEGFERDLKARGEDLATGKVTMPVAKAVGRLSYPDRRRLWEILADPSGDWGAIQEAIDLVTGCGALAACRQEAGQLVEDGWRRLDPLLPDSRTKVLLRAFSWFVLDRHY